jgi:hypothetical protein
MPIASMLTLPVLGEFRICGRLLLSITGVSLPGPGKRLRTGDAAKGLGHRAFTLNHCAIKGGV